jgi:hypothetical protein
MTSTFNKLKVLSTITLVIFMLSGCTIYKTVPLEKSSNNIEVNITYGKIFIIHTKGSNLDFILSKPFFNNNTLSGVLLNMPAGKKPAADKEYFPKRHVTTYDPENVVHIYTVFEKLDLGENSFSMQEIESMTYNKIANGRSGLGTLAVMGVIPAVGIGAFVAIFCTCPEVTTFNNNTEIHHGSLFPGSLLNSLERDDYLILEKPVNEDNEINIKIANVTPETQYINQLEILEVEHKGFENIALTNNNNLAAYNQSITPKSAVENDFKDVSNLLLEKDGKSFQFDNPDAKELNQVVLIFDKSALSNNPALVIHAQQSPWLDTVATVILSQAGKHQEKWTNNKDNKISPEKWKKNNQKRGLSLNVYLKKEDKWQYAGTHHDVGTGSKRTLLMPLDLTNINTDKVEIKLESAFRIWEVDYVGLTNNWSTELKKTPLKLNAATNQNGKNVIETITATDEQEVMQEEGGFVEINATTTASEESTLVLHGYGYYHKHSEFDNNINLLFFAKFKQKMGLHDVSKMLYQEINMVQ